MHEMERSQDFKTYLQEELVLRCKRNSAYSLRSFAKALGVSPSFLSKILNGQRRITENTFQKLAANLNLESKVKSTFKTQNNTDGVMFNNLELEYFKIISDWYHYALLELTRIQGFQSAPEWIANKLGITVNQAKAAIERLLHLELLETKNGKLRATSGGNTTTKNEFTDLAFKKMQDALLQKAITTLWDEDLSKRDHTSICMAIDPNDIPEVKKRLTTTRREICKFLERPKHTKPKQVYNLSLAFFPLSKGEP